MLRNSECFYFILIQLDQIQKFFKFFQFNVGFQQAFAAIECQILIHFVEERIFDGIVWVSGDVFERRFQPSNFLKMLKQILRCRFNKFFGLKFELLRKKLPRKESLSWQFNQIVDDSIANLKSLRCSGCSFKLLIVKRVNFDKISIIVKNVDKNYICNGSEITLVLKKNYVVVTFSNLLSSFDRKSNLFSIKFKFLDRILEVPATWSHCGSCELISRTMSIGS